MTTTTRDTTRICASLGLLPALTLIARTAAPGIFPAPSIGLRYPAPTGSIEDAAAILLQNGRVAALVLGATILVITAPATKTSLTVVLSLVAAINVTRICAAIADDGTRAAVALLPHGPLELLAFSRLAALFMAARRNPVTPRAIGTATAHGIALLTAAALLEVVPT